MNLELKVWLWHTKWLFFITPHKFWFLLFHLAHENTNFSIFEVQILNWSKPKIFIYKRGKKCFLEVMVTFRKYSTKCQMALNFFFWYRCWTTVLVLIKLTFKSYRIKLLFIIYNIIKNNTQKLITATISRETAEFDPRPVILLMSHIVILFCSLFKGAFPFERWLWLRLYFNQSSHIENLIFP